jgi:hypothetical protein
MESLQAVERRLAGLPRVLPRFSETALRLEIRPAPSRSGRAAAAMAAAAAILMTLTFFLRPAPPPETEASRLAPRVHALVQSMLQAQGEQREALVLELMNLGPDALPLLEPQVEKAPEIADIVAVLVAAQETRVTVTSTSGEMIGGALVTTAFKMKTGFGDTTVQVAKIVSIEFGTTDVVTTREKTQLKGKILLDEFKLKTDGGETMALKRANLASITVDGAGAKFEKGKIEDGTARNGVTYHVRLPAKHDPKKPSPAILILHGSNMNSKTYVETLLQAWPRLGETYVLIGINGEQKAQGGTEANPAYNYTYINFAGRASTRGSPAPTAKVPRWSPRR